MKLAKEKPSPRVEDKRKDIPPAGISIRSLSASAERKQREKNTTVVHKNIPAKKRAY